MPKRSGGGSKKVIKMALYERKHTQYSIVIVMDDMMFIDFYSKGYAIVAFGVIFRHFLPE